MIKEKNKYEVRDGEIWRYAYNPYCSAHEWQQLGQEEVVVLIEALEEKLEIALYNRERVEQEIEKVRSYRDGITDALQLVTATKAMY